MCLCLSRGQLQCCAAQESIPTKGPSREAMGTIFAVFGMTGPGNQPTSYQSQDRLPDH